MILHCSDLVYLKSSKPLFQYLYRAMGKNSFFKFKKFTIQQNNVAMKVGTDGILLGAWTDIEKCARILDIGTGTGLIALMLAQRSEAEITAIEVEQNAAKQALQNVLDSPWNHRVKVEHISLQSYTAKNSRNFDLIVSNPPFFSQSLKAGNSERTLARHNDSLPFQELLQCSSDLLNKAGRLALVLPNEGADFVKGNALDAGLFLVRETLVKPKPKKEANRILLEFGKKEIRPVKESLTIYSDYGSAYSDEFKSLTRDFYLRL